ncbi:MAG: HD-GYP domain-containing protein [Betaproteobacteria bacterium]|nr:HD-GYP domain-containing protein [Betaproteobacteria bacterium]
MPGAPTAADISRDLDQTIQRISGSTTRLAAELGLTEALAYAKSARLDGKEIVRSITAEARSNHSLSLDAPRELVGRIAASIAQNPGALLSLCQIKEKDEYTYLHPVSVAALMVAFARTLHLDESAVHDAGLGGLLLDIGKAFTPDAIPHKPGPLTEAEFAVVQRHPSEGCSLFARDSRVSKTVPNIIGEHHERLDGSGYPKKLKGDAISHLGQMAAIVDVYDAMTAHRVHQHATPPTETLRKLLEWSKHHFNPDLVQAFIRCIGIYPVGSVVRLESDRIAVVVEQSEKSLLKPKVRVIYHAKHERFLMPEDIELSRSLGHGGGDRIISHESANTWRIDARRFL